MNTRHFTRGMQTQNGNWIQSDLTIGAKNGRELGVKTQLSNPKDKDIDVINGMVSPSNQGLSTNLSEFAENINNVFDRLRQGGKEGALGRISIKEVLNQGLIPYFDPKNPAHVLLIPNSSMPFSEYQQKLNTLPWVKIRNM
jgi:hypothetical protein